MAAESAGEVMRGESASLDDVYAAEIQRLVALGTVLTGDGAAGEDLAHDAFLQLGAAGPPPAGLPQRPGPAAASDHGRPARDATTTRVGTGTPPPRPSLAARPKRGLGAERCRARLAFRLADPAAEDACHGGAVLRRGSQHRSDGSSTRVLTSNGGDPAPCRPPAACGADAMGRRGGRLAMTPTTFDDRARAETQRLLSDATRLPSSVSLDRGRPARWKTFVVFAATVLVIGGAVAGASFALRPSAAEKPAPATYFGRWKAFDLPPRGDSPDAIPAPTRTPASQSITTETSSSRRIRRVARMPGPSARSIPRRWSTRNPNQTMTGVSCADPSLCVAVDESGNVVTSTNPGGGASAWILSGIDGAVSLTGVLVSR